MDAKEAAKILAEELADYWYPKTKDISGRVFEQLIKSAEQNYRYFGATEREFELDGSKLTATFYSVGHNASHQFEIALLPDGRLIVRSDGEGDEWSEELGYYLHKEHVSVAGDSSECRWPYVGHW